MPPLRRAAITTAFLLPLLVAAIEHSPPRAQEADTSRVALPAEEEWTVTGGSLTGEREGVTRLTDPRAVRGNTIVTAREGIWRRAEDLLILLGEVELRDATSRVTSDSATYRRAEDLAILVGNVRGSDPDGTFASRKLWYFRREGRILLADSAMVSDAGRELRAREITYWTRERRATAIGDVVLVDPAESTRVTGERCELDRASDRIVMTGSPLLRRSGTARSPDLVVRADTLVMRRAESIGEARGNVHVTRGSVQARSGRAVFDLSRDLMILKDEPVAFDPDGTVTGDSMAIVLRRGRAERLEVLGHALLEYRPLRNPGEVNFVTGDTLVARIDSAGVRAIEVRGTARSLYIPAPQDRAEDVGANLARGERIVLSLEQGEAERVDLTGRATGEYVLPREKPDTTRARLPDSLYVARAKEHFLSSPEKPLPDSLEAAGPFDVKERVAYQGDSIAFHVPERKIVIRKAGKVHYQNLELESEEIDYDAPRERVTALGKPSLADPESKLLGRRMVYRLDRRQGFVYQGKTAFEGGFYSGEEIKRVDDKILLVRQGDYTTCDADTSHYHFHSTRMKIILGDKVAARPIVLYVQDIPIMALPYWVFPIRRGRHSGILMPDVEFGFDETRGRFVRNVGYYWAPDDYSDAMLWGDYYERNPRWIVNSQVRYRLRYRLSGDLFASYSRQDYAGARTTRWDVRGGHEQELGERFTLKFRADFASDKDYRDDRDFGGTIDERLNRILKSNLDVRKTWPTTSLSVTADRTENLDRESSSFQVQQNLPSVDLSFNSFPIGRKEDALGRGARWPLLSTLYARVSASVRSTFRKDWGEKTQDNQALRVTGGLTDNRSLGDFLNLSPSVSATGAYFRRDARGESHQLGGVWDAGLGARSTIYGTFLPNWGPLIGIRHVVEPSVSYRYSPEFSSLKYVNADTVEVARFPSVGGISLSGSEVSSMSMSLSQRFHLKLRGSDPKKPIKIDNLITWTTSTGYDFLRRGTGRSPWSAISNNLRLNPARFFDSSCSVTHDPETLGLRQLSVQTNLRLSGGAARAAAGAPGDTSGSPIEEYGGFGQAGTGSGRPGQKTAPSTGPWSLSVSHSYSRGASRATESNRVNFSLSVNPTRSWRLQGSLYYDLRDHETVSRSYSLYRDLHCWEIHFDWRTLAQSSEYYFRINIKALPDVQYERQKR